MVKKYNVIDFLGSDYVFENNIFIGIVILMWDFISKNNVINDFVVKYDLDLLNLYVYGDINGDINMLKRVGNLIVINLIKEFLF